MNIQPDTLNNVDLNEPQDAKILLNVLKSDLTLDLKIFTDFFNENLNSSFLGAMSQMSSSISTGNPLQSYDFDITHELSTPTLTHQQSPYSPMSAPYMMDRRCSLKDRNLDSMTVLQLKKSCKKRGLLQTGSKRHLMGRLNVQLHWTQVQSILHDS